MTSTIQKNEVITTEIPTIVQTYSRRPFEVQAARVRSDNMADIAKWCGGTVEETRGGVPFVEVGIRPDSKSPHKRAFVGFWVVTSKDGFFSSYSDKAFHRTFERR